MHINWHCFIIEFFEFLHELQTIQKARPDATYFSTEL